MKCSPGDKLASRWPRNVKNAVTHDAEMPVLPEKSLFGEGLASDLLMICKLLEVSRELR